MQVCRKCKATWPDSLIDEWGTHAESSGYGPEPKCVAVVPDRRNPGAHQVCSGQLAYWEDDEKDTGQLFLLSPIGDNTARQEAEKHNAARLDALRQGR